MSAPNTGGTPETEKLSTPTRRRSGTIGTGVAIAIAIVLLIVGVGAGYYIGNSTKSNSSASTIQLTETGSSLLFPLMVSWGPNYTSYNSQVVLAPASTGSGTGQSYAENGLVNIGASDGYLANASATSLLNLPVAFSAQLIYYNLPGITAHLNLNGSVLAKIYEGTITKWNDPEILAAQSSAVQTKLNGLSSQTIVPIKRSDSSGDTFLFSSLCYMSWSGWTYKYSTSALSGSPWTGANGNSGVVQALIKTSDSIGYVGISYESAATGLGYAAVGDNQSLTASGGIDPANYILPSAQNVSNDANLGLTHLQFSQYQLAVSLILGGSPAGAINLISGAGGTNSAPGLPAYPIVNLEYTLIKTSPTGKTVTSSALTATVHFLQWAISYGNFAPNGAPSSYINVVNFIPLTPEVIGYDQQELAQVQA